MTMARTQTLVQLSDDLLAQLDRYRARDGRSRSEVIRTAIEHYLGADREAAIDRQIVDAYTRRPRMTHGRGRRPSHDCCEPGEPRRGLVGRAPRSRPAASVHPDPPAAIAVLTSVLVAPATRTVRGSPRRWR
jgi:predicted transcriptional regulator